AGASIQHVGRTTTVVIVAAIAVQFVVPGASFDYIRIAASNQNIGRVATAQIGGRPCRSHRQIVAVTSGDILRTINTVECAATGNVGDTRYGSRYAGSCSHWNQCHPAKGNAQVNAGALDIDVAEVYEFNPPWEIRRAHSTDEHFRLDQEFA